MAAKKQKEQEGKVEQEPIETTVTDIKLTVKQQRFIEEYCIDFNATAAAIRAGYSENTAFIIGWENLRKPKIKELIEMRISALTMSADEALLKLSEYARGSFTPFLEIDDNNNVTVDLLSEPAQKSMHLIKKIKQTKRKIGDDIIDVTTEIELHDSKDAVKTILQMHGKIVDKKTVDHTNAGGKFEANPVVVDYKSLTDEQLRNIAAGKS